MEAVGESCHVFYTYVHSQCETGWRRLPQACIFLSPGRVKVSHCWLRGIPCSLPVWSAAVTASMAQWRCCESWNTASVHKENRHRLVGLLSSFTGGKKLSAYEVALVLRGRDEVHTVDAQSANKLADCSNCRVCLVQTNLAENAFAGSHFLRHVSQVHLLSFPDGTEIQWDFLFRKIHVEASFDCPNQYAECCALCYFCALYSTFWFVLFIVTQIRALSFAFLLHLLLFKVRKLQVQVGHPGKMS